MTIKQLREHRANAEKLECIERNLRQNEVHICVEGSAGAPSFEKRPKSDFGYIHGMGTVSLLAEKAKLEKENKRIENYIDAIPNRRVYTALYLYCIDETLYNPTWDEVAAEMKEVSTKALKTQVERFLKSVARCG